MERRAARVVCAFKRASAVCDVVVKKRIEGGAGR